MILNVLLEAGPPNWGAGSADDGLGGVVAATADTRPAVIRQFKSALKFHLEGLRLEGIEVPVIESLELHEVIPFDAAGI